MDLVYENNLLKERCDMLEKMYQEDTERLLKERDMWKNRCLEAEASKARANRQLRHV